MLDVKLKSSEIYGFMLGFEFESDIVFRINGD
jgi:hypothetical protein